jgi:hypothetical protein
MTPHFYLQGVIQTPETMGSIKHLRRSDWKALITLPESERIGALIRLNRTIYHNRLDAIQIFLILHNRKLKSRIREAS